MNFFLINFEQCCPDGFTIQAIQMALSVVIF